MKRGSVLLIFLISLLLSSCFPRRPANNSTPNSLLWVLYTSNGNINLYESSNDFVPSPNPKKIISGVRNQSARISITNFIARNHITDEVYSNSQWITWKEGNNIYVKPVWQGPSNKYLQNFCVNVY